MRASVDVAAALKLVFACFSFGLGACIASFLNVVIWRVPRGESIVSPPSHCPKCGSAIRWWQNIPILSWLALRGKCANCRAPISPRYILVETLGGVLFLSALLLVVFRGAGWFSFLHCGIVGDAAAVLVLWIWISLMIAGSFIDFDHQLLPDFTTIGGMVLGLMFSLVQTACLACAEGGRGRDAAWIPLAWSLAGLAFGFGLLWLVRWLGSKAFGREAMGMGDVFLMGAVGALFGPVAVIVTLILSSVFGSVVGVGMVLLSRARLGKFVAIPYGPYICLGCLAWMFRGPEMVEWYLHLVK